MLTALFFVMTFATIESEKGEIVSPSRRWVSTRTPSPVGRTRRVTRPPARLTVRVKVLLRSTSPETGRSTWRTLGSSPPMSTSPG